VIGREFGYELIEGVAQRPATELQIGLDRLAEAGLLFCRGVAPQSSYLFKHALVQDAAYSTLLRAARQRLHRRIGEVLEEQFPAIAETQPELLAHHFTEAGLPARAITYWHLGGQRSAAKSAVVEGVEQLRRGLRLISDLPDAHERAQRELELQAELGSTLQKAKGHGHPEVIDAWERARELIAITGAVHTPLGFSVLWGLCIANYAGGNVRSALRQAEEYLSIAQSRAETGPLAIGHRLIGTALMLSGVFPAALSHLEHAVSLCTAEAHPTLASRFGQDTSVTALCYYSWALWHRGYPEQARKASDDALRHAEHSGDAFTLSYALFGSRWRAAFERHTAEVERFADEQATLTGAHGFGWSTFTVCKAGRWPSVATVQPPSSVSAKVMRYSAGRGSGRANLSIWACWPRPTRSPAISKQGWRPLPRVWRREKLPARKWPMPSCTGCAATSYGVCRSPIYREPRPPCARRWPWLGNRAHADLNCAPRRASPSCGAIRAGGPKHAICSRRFTTGSQRASTPPI
jgi:tetratricopeptide (TPR) repeat protein